MDNSKHKRELLQRTTEILNIIDCYTEIPPCGTIEILLLSTKQYGINLLDISIKFEQCPVTIRKSLKESPNEDIRELFLITNVGSNIKYDSFQSTREVLTQTRQSKTEKITGLKSQSEIVTSVWQEALVSTRSKWFSVQKVLPKNIFNFTVRYFNNTLATKTCKSGEKI